MSTILQEYESVYWTIESFNTTISKYQKEIDQIGSRRDNEIPARIENLKNQLKKIDEYQEKIDAAKQIAENHLISKNLPTIEAPEGYRVNLNRLKNWTSLIDPLSEDDSYAKRVFMVATCDTVFLQQKKVEFEKRLEELENDYKKGAPDEIKELESKIASSTAELHEYLKGEDFGHFVQGVISQNESYLYKESPKEYHVDEKTGEFWVPGASSYPLKVDVEGKNIIKSLLGNNYDADKGEVYLPVQCISRQDEFAMTITCVPNRQYLGEMDAGLRNLILRMVDETADSSKRIYIFDAVRYNSSIVGGLKDLEGTFAMPDIPRNTETMTQSLEELVSSFSDIDDLLENYDSVSEYNKAVEKEKRIPRSLVVIVGWPKAFDNNQHKYIERIVSNYERYGISFVVARIEAPKKRNSNEEDKWGLSDYIGEKLISITMSAKNCTIAIGDNKEQHFRWYTFKCILNDSYISAVKSLQTRDNSPKNVYTDHINLDNIPDYVRGNKTLILSYGIDSKGVLRSTSFENEGFAAYLMGASGSGKSTLLHTLITDIIRNYHPDDVELWLADFKMSEFAQYMDPLPPHVKYILLDESEELVFDLIDKLTEKMMERQRFFMLHRDLKKVENIPAEMKKYMPIIFVVLDEFSIMSQTLSESEVYKLKLQNLLAKGRALGIKFVFSSQTFRSGIAGLTATAKEQIQTRIAMKNSLDEINETLSLTSSIKTEQVKNWMEALPVHYALEKYRDKENLFVRRNLVLYFPGKGDAAMQPQRNLINRIKSKLRVVDEEQFGIGLDTYVEKHPVVIDGNSYKKFDSQLIGDLRTKYNKSDNLLWKDTVISVGEPRRLAQVKFIPISNESRQNMLLLAPNSEIAQAMSILESIMVQVTEQGASVHIWTYNRNRIYQAYKGFFEKYSVAEGIEGVSHAIHRLAGKVKNRENANDYYIILGLEQLYMDFDLMQGKDDGFIGNMDEIVAERAKRDAELTASSDEEKEELNRMNEKYADLSEAIDLMTEEWFDQGKSMEEISAEIDRMTKEYNENIKDYQKNKTSKKSKEDTVAISKYEQKKEEKLNPKNDLQYLLSQGSRWGYHFVIALNNYSDLKMAGVNLERFSHRLSFQLSKDDSIDYFGTSIASKLPEHICQYSNMIDKFSFRPYLHRGIGWEGWEVDQLGNVLDPSKSINE